MENLHKLRNSAAHQVAAIEAGESALKMMLFYQKQGLTLEQGIVSLTDTLKQLKGWLREGDYDKS